MSWRRPILLRVSFISLSFVSLMSVVFDIWSMSQCNGGPAIGSFLFGLIGFAISVFLLLALWHWKWVKIVDPVGWVYKEQEEETVQEVVEITV
jgi:hypothetical protein